MASNLEIQLSFKPLFAGLNRFSNALEKRLKKVDALNKRIENGAASSNALLQQAATFISGAAVIGGLNRLISGGVKYNAVIEQQSSAFETLLGSADKAQARIESLVDFAATTPFQLLQVVQASKILQAFTGNALSSGEGLRLVGDAAAAVGAPFEAVAMWVGRLYAALEQGAPLGEPIQNLTQLGLVSGEARRQLFALQGTALSNADAMDQLRQVFGFAAGAMERQASTFNGVLSTMRDTIDALAGQATQRLTKRLKDFNKRLIDLGSSESAINLLTALADNAALVVQALGWLTGAFADLGPPAQAVLVSILDTMLKLSIPMGALLAFFVLLKGAMAAAALVASPLRQGFTFITGVDLVDGIRDIQMFSKELGILKAFSKGNWGGRIAASLGLAGAALAGVAIGSALITAIESAEEARLNRENQIREAMVGQTRELLDQVAAATTLYQLKILAEQTDKEALEVQAEIAKLEEKKAKAIALKHAMNTSGVFPGVYVSASNALFRREDQVRLDALKDRFANLRRNIERLKDPADQLQVNLEAVNTEEAREEISKLVDKLEDLRALRASQIFGALDPKSRLGKLEAQRAALVRQLDAIPTETDGNPEVDESHEARRLDLENRLFEVRQAMLSTEREVTAELDAQAEATRKRELFDLESRALAAESTGNAVRAKQLREEIERRKLLNDLGGDHLALVDARMAAQEALAGFENSQIQSEITFSRELGDLERQRAEIEADRYLTNAEKEAQILPLLGEENRLIAARIEMMEQELLLGVTDEKAGELRQKIDELHERLAQNAGDQKAIEPQTLGQGIEQGTNAFFDSVGKRAEQAARAVQSVWQRTASSIQSALYRTFTGAISAGDGLKEIALGFGQSMLQAFTQMLAEYAAKKAAMFAIDVLFSGKSLALSLASAAKSLAAWMPAAIAAGISSFGTSAVIGTAAVLGAVAAFGGFRATGGDVAAGQAYVVGDGGVPELFVPGSDGYVFPSVPDLSGAVASGLTQPSLFAGSGGGGFAGGSGGGVDMEDLAGRITIIQVASLQEAQGVARHSRARGDIARIVSEDFGLKPRTS